jgi:uncharacterized iron-regulated protein
LQESTIFSTINAECILAYIVAMSMISRDKPALMDSVREKHIDPIEKMIEAHSQALISLKMLAEESNNRLDEYFEKLHEAKFNFKITMSRMCENISDAMVLWKHLLNVVKANDK